MRQTEYLGRGRVHITAALLPSGAVSTADPSWGTNWPSVPSPPGLLVMPPGRPLGNARQLTIAQQVAMPAVAAYPPPGASVGGPIVQSVTATLSLYGMGAQHLADYLGGVRHELVGRDVVDVISSGGARLPTDCMLFASAPIDLRAPVSVVPSWTVWTEDVHWRAETFGARLLLGCAAPPGSSVRLSYRSAGGADVVESLQAYREVGVVYEGVNAINGRPVRADIYRAQMPPAQSHDLIGDGIAVVEMTLNLQPVLPAPGARPRWYRITQVAEAI